MAGVKVSIGADSTKAERVLTSFEQKTKKIAGSIAKGFKERVGHKMFDGLLSAAAKVPQMLAYSVNAASDLNEEISKGQVIFGSAAKEIQDFAKTSVESLGLSELAAMEAAGQFGNLFKTMGMGENDVARMSKEMSGLAADLGSFHNTTTEDAIMAIGAALRGESEPIRRYGVLLDDATLKAEALAQGLYDGKGSLAPATRALAAYSVILKQTSDAQGDFANTSSGLAGQKKILQAQLQNLAREIGTSLLPMVKQAVTALNGMDFGAIAKSVTRVIKTIVDLTPAVLALAVAFQSFKIAQFWATMVAGLVKSISLWGAETAAVNANTTAKTRNAAAGAGGAMGGKGKGKGAGTAMLIPQVAAIVGTAFAGFELGKIIGEPLADLLVDDGPMSMAANPSKVDQPDEAPVDPEIAALEKANAAFRAGLQAESDANKEKSKKRAEEEAAAEEKKKNTVKSIREEYKKTLEILDAQIRGDKKLLEQEELRKQISEEQNKLARDGVIISKESAGKIVTKRNEALAAEQKRQLDAEAESGMRETKQGDLQTSISDTEGKLDFQSSRSSLQAVSSMQSIGGGGGSFGTLDIQKRQADLQTDMVRLLTQLNSNSEEPVSDF
jgi:hypothetical protein